MRIKSSANPFALGVGDKITPEWNNYCKGTESLEELKLWTQYEFSREILEVKLAVDEIKKSLKKSKGSVFEAKKIPLIQKIKTSRGTVDSKREYDVEINRDKDGFGWVKIWDIIIRVTNLNIGSIVIPLSLVWDFPQKPFTEIALLEKKDLVDRLKYGETLFNAEHRIEGFRLLNDGEKYSEKISFVERAVDSNGKVLKAGHAFVYGSFRLDTRAGIEQVFEDSKKELKRLYEEARESYSLESPIIPKKEKNSLVSLQKDLELFRLSRLFQHKKLSKTQLNQSRTLLNKGQTLESNISRSRTKISKILSSMGTFNP